MSEVAGNIAEQSPHWFAIPGEQNGRRSLNEQMTGLHPALAEAHGRTVFDMGCAEGCIALEFARAGGTVYAVDYNPAMIETANRISREPVALAFEAVDLREVIRKARLRRQWREFDIVLALAVLHKLDDPKAGTEFVAQSCNDLAVIRLPHGSTGFIRAKHSANACDVGRVMTQHDFALEKTVTGPRAEQVQYWRRNR